MSQTFDTPQTTEQERRRGMGLLFACLLSLGMGQSLVFAILPPLARDLGLNEVQVSAIFTLSAVLWVVMSPIWGRYSDSWGRRPVILLGLTGFGVSMGGFGFLLLVGQWKVLPLMTLYILLIFVRAIFGLMGAGTPSAAQAYVADRTTRTERTSGVAALGAAYGIGTIIGPGFAAGLAEVHLLAPFYVLAMLALTDATAIFFLLPERRRPSESKSQDAKLRINDPRVRPFLLMGVAISTIQAAVMQVMAFYVMDVMELSGAETARVVGIGIMSMAVSTLFAQLVIIPRMHLSVHNLLLWGIWVNGAGVAMLLLPMSVGIFVIAMTVQGLGMGLLRPAVTAGGSLSVSADEQGAVAGLNNATAAIGVIIVPITVMPLYLLMPSAPFWFAFILSLGMLLMVRGPIVEALDTPIDSEEIEAQTYSTPTRH